jgi:hypothetical protein
MSFESEWRSYAAAVRVERHRAAAESLRLTDPETYRQILDTAEGEAAESAGQDPDAYVALFLSYAQDDDVFTGQAPEQHDQQTGPEAPVGLAPTCSGSQRKPHPPVQTVPVEDPVAPTYRCPICGREQRAMPEFDAPSMVAQPRSSKRRWPLPVAIVALLVGAGIVAGLWIYRSSGQSAYTSAHRAYVRYDCQAAAPKLSHVTHFYRLTFASYVGKAKTQERQCRAVVRAQEEAANGNYASATSGLEALLHTKDPLPIAKAIHLNLADSYVAWGKQTLAGASVPGEFVDAALETERAYRHVGPRVGAVDDAMLRIWRGVINDTACRSVPRLRALSAARFATARGSTLASAADNVLPKNLLQCAKTDFQAHRFGAAATQLIALTRDYPRSPQAKAAGTLLIDAQVAAIRQGQTGKLPSPQVTGTTAYGEAKLVIANDSPRPLELLLSGPTSKRLLIAACRSCRTYGSTPASYTCGNVTPSVTAVLNPGSYDVVARSPEGHVEPFSGTWELSSGNRYDHCFFIVTSGG